MRKYYHGQSVLVWPHMIQCHEFQHVPYLTPPKKGIFGLNDYYVIESWNWRLGWLALDTGNVKVLVDWNLRQQMREIFNVWLYYKKHRGWTNKTSARINWHDTIIKKNAEISEGLEKSKGSQVGEVCDKETLKVHRGDVALICTYWQELSLDLN